MNQFTSGRKREWDYIGPESTDKQSSFVKSISISRNTGITHSSRVFFRFSVLISDLVAINLINFILVLVLQGVTSPPEYILLFIVINFNWIVSAYFSAVYFAHEKFFKRSVQAFLLYVALTLLFIFVYNYSYSRLFVLLSFSSFAASLVVLRTIIIGTQHFFKNRTTVKNIIFLGYNDLSHHLAVKLSGKRHLHKVHGYFDDNHSFNDHEFHPLLGNIQESLGYALQNGISEIYSTIPPETNPVIYEIAQQAEMNLIRFKFVPDFRIFIKRKVHIGFENDIPIFSLHLEPLQNLECRFKKRVFDILFSSFVILFILSWLLPIIALLIKLESRGPVFFKQLRSGKNNKPFHCLKFRSLHVNSEADKKQVTRNDKRFTKFGKFLRKSNLDELPQFFNVLQGRMSIVGPRPHMLKHTEEYSAMMNRYMVRHFVKPGVTGWAQINGYRGEIKTVDQLQKRVEYDIAYMENWSMWLDLKIILLTVYTTLRGDKNAF